MARLSKMLVLALMLVGAAVACSSGGGESSGLRPDTELPEDVAGGVDVEAPDDTGRDTGTPPGEVSCVWEEPIPGDTAPVVGGVVLLRARCTAGDDDVTAVQFQVDGSFVGQLTGPSDDERYAMEIDSATLADGPHELIVGARAASGASGFAGLTVETDNTPPEVVIEAPDEGAMFVGELPLTFRASDPHGASPATVTLAGDTFGPFEHTPGESQSVTLNVSRILTGDHRLTVLVDDVLGNRGEAFVDVRVVTAPALRGRIVSPTQLGTVPNDVVAADADGDGRRDVLLATNLGLFVLPGRGDGRFSAPKAALESVRLERIVATDLDGDGDDDLVAGVATNEGRYLRVYLSSGDGTWERHAATDHEIPEKPTVMKLADLNADEKPDVLLGGDRDESSLIVLLRRDESDGGSFFGDTHTMDAGAGVTLVRDIAVGDLDGDGFNDVVVGREEPFFTVFPGRGDGTFYIGRTVGKDDGCTCNSLEVFNCFFSALSTAVGYFDDDDNLDIAASQLAGGFVVYAGDGDWQPTLSECMGRGYYDSAAGTERLLVDDVDEDGYQDIIVINTDDKNAGVFLGSRGGTFTEGELFNIGRDASFAQLVDVTGDDRADLLVYNLIERAISVLPSRGNGSFGGAVELRLTLDPVLKGTRPEADLVPVDFDGDGDLDLAVVTQTYTEMGIHYADLFVFISGGDYPRMPPQAHQIELQYSEIVDMEAGFVSGQSTPDLILATRNNVHVLTGDGSGGVHTNHPVQLFGIEKLSAITLCDVDGQAPVDLVVGTDGYQSGGDPVPPLLHLFRLPRPFATTLSVSGQGILTGDPTDLACAAVSADTVLDFLTLNTTDGVLNYYEGAGEVPWVDDGRQVLALGENPVRLAVADLDLDGEVDAVATVRDNIAIAFGATGAGAFESSAFLQHTGRIPYGVAIGDVTDDGLPDIAVANSAGQTVSVYVNAGSREFLGPVDIDSGRKPTELASADFNEDGCLDFAVLNRESWTVTLFMGEGALCDVSP